MADYVSLAQQRIQLANEAINAGNWLGAANYLNAASTYTGKSGNTAVQAAYNSAQQRLLDAQYPQPSGGTPTAAAAGPTGGGGTPYDPAKAYYDGLAAEDAARKKLAQDSMILQMRSFMEGAGMTDLLNAMEKYVRLGYSGDAIWFMTKNDPQYQAAYASRFAANAERAKLGLAELSPASYIELEQGYKSAMMSRGMPTGLFDQASDFTRLIAGDVSVREVEGRLDEALEYINFSGNAAVRDQLRSLYGMSDGEMAAYMLDPTKTLDFLQRQMSTNQNRAAVGGAAANTGVAIGTNVRDQIAEMMAMYNSTDQAYAQSMTGFNAVAEQTPAYTRLAGYSEIGATGEELVQEQFALEGAAEVTNKKKVLASQERARFGGSSGLASSSLSAGRKAQ